MIRLPTPIPPKEATETTPYLLYEAPITGLWFVGFILDPDLSNSAFWGTIIDLSGLLEESNFQDGGLLLPGRFYPNPPHMFQKLVENTTDEFKRLLEHKAPFSEMASVWANQPEIYRTFVDKRKNQGERNRQDSYIILNWWLWEQNRVPFKERVAQISKDGFGTLTPKSLQKRAERWKLSEDIGDNSAEVVAIDLLESAKMVILYGANEEPIVGEPG